MKRCPQCDRVYSDDSLRFCLNDGSVLSGGPAASVQDPHATLPYGPSGPAFVEPSPRISEPATQVNSGAASPYPQIREPVTSGNSMLTVGVIAIAASLLIIAGIAVVFLIRTQSPISQRDASTTNNVPVKASSPQSNATPAAVDSSESSLPANAAGLKIRTSASSVRYSVQSNTYDPSNALDNKRQTAWLEGSDGSGVGEWLRFDFDREIVLHRILILPGYFKSPDIWRQNNRIAAATFFFSDGSSHSADFADVMQKQSVDVGAVRTRWVKIQIDRVFAGSDPDAAISEVVFEWTP